MTPAIPPGEANDTLTGGAGSDTFEFRALLDARPEVIAEHTRDDGSVNWRGGELVDDCWKNTI